MSAIAKLSAVLTLQMPPAVGTRDFLQKELEVDAAIEALTDTIAQIAITPDDNITGDPQTIELELMAIAQSITPDHTAEDFDCTGHGYEEGQAVQLGGTAAPTGLTLAVMYYIKYVDANTFQLAAVRGGAALTFSDNGTDVTVRAFGSINVDTSYPSIGPGVPIEVRQNLNGQPNDFTKVKALQIVLRPLNTAANALGSVQLIAGDSTDRYNYIAIPLRLNYTAGGAQTWASWTAALPDGFVYDTTNHLTVRIKDDESNTNLLILINLLGN